MGKLGNFSFFVRNKYILINCALVILLAADLGFSYYQYSQSYIDGDFAKIVLGYGDYGKVLHDPLGWAALNGETYPGTNRFTAHAVMAGYFRTLPFILQTFLSPLESLYTSFAITKLLVHIALVFLLSYYASRWSGFQWKSFFISAIVISPFFHAGVTFYKYLTLIDDSITYTMFYALPMVFVLLFLLPFYKYYLTGKISHNPWFVGFWAIFIFFLALFGPLSSPIILLFSFIALAFLTTKHFFQMEGADPFFRFLRAIKKIDLVVSLLLGWGLVVSLYSFYIGLKNSENQWSPKSLEERFTLLIQGLKEAFLNPDNGWYYLGIATGINILLLFIFYRKKQRLYFKLIFFLIIFAILYLGLLPFGGYRSYRPLIVKHDTLAPILLLVLFIWSSSIILFLGYLKKFNKLAYIILLLPILFFYTINDNKMKQNNDCEKATLLKLASSTEDCVILPRKCAVTSWWYITQCEKVEASSTLLVYYNIFPRKILYKMED